jgi:hypothetical protein
MILKPESSLGVFFKILIPKVFAFCILILIFNFDLKFYFIYFLVHEYEIKKSPKNSKKDRKLLVDNFQTKKKIFVLMENWCADWITNHKGMFGIIVAIVIQNSFRLEMD